MINCQFRKHQTKKIFCLKKFFVFKLRVISTDLRNILGHKTLEAKKQKCVLRLIMGFLIILQYRKLYLIDYLSIMVRQKMKGKK